MNLNSEDEFLKQQADEAWSAMGNTFAQAASAMHPKHWKARTWWIALGATAVTGFVVAAAVARRHSASAAANHCQPSQPPPQPKRHRISGIIKFVLELAAIARPVLQSILAGFVAHASHEGASHPGGAQTPPPSV